jgi:hypothetical protein
LQFGVEYVSRAAQKKDRGLTVGRRHQLKVLGREDNIKGDRTKKICRFVTSNFTQIGQNVPNVKSKFCNAIRPVLVSVVI